MRVLIVEDEMLIARATKLQLQEVGHTVIGLAKDEKSCFELISLNPELILMDIKLSRNCSGIELAKKLRSRGITSPIIFTTGNSKKLTQEEIKDIANTTILNKPIDFVQLLSRIGEINLES